MNWRGWWPVALIPAVVWALFGYYDSKPADFHDYRTAAVSAAQSAYHSVATAQLTVRAELDGDAFGGYVRAALDDAVDATSGAVRTFAGQEPVDPATTRMRDELGPVLLAAVSALGDLQRAERSGDRAERRRAVDALQPVADRLSDFIERHR